MIPDIHRIEYIFALGISGGLLVGSWFVVWTALQYPGQKWQRWLDVYLLTVLAGIIGARIGYVLMNPGDFQDAPLYVFRLWYGALSWQGASVGAGLAVIFLCRWLKIPFPLFADGIALANPVILMAVSWSCRKAGCLLGPEVSNTEDYPVWMVSYLPDVQRNVVPRYELQMLAIGLFLLTLVIMAGLTLKNLFATRRLWISLFLTGLALLLLFSLQNNDLNFDKISALILAGAGVAFGPASANRMAVQQTEYAIMPGHENT